MANPDPFKSVRTKSRGSSVARVLSSEEWLEIKRQETLDYLKEQQQKSQRYRDQQARNTTDYLQEQEVTTSQYLERQRIETAKALGATEQEAIRQTFTDYESPPENKSIWKIQAIKLYRPPKPIEVPETTFSDICPGQFHVNRQIVEAKIQSKMPATPVVPAVLTNDGKITLLDKHHTFVACMALGKSVKIALVNAGTPTPMKDWTTCTWKGFEQRAEAQPGFKLTEKEARNLEGQEEVAEDWRDIVPWRKNIPPTDEGKAKELINSIDSLPNAKGVNKELVLACQDDLGLAEKLYDTIKIGVVRIKLRKKPKGSTGGDWNAAENTIYLDDDLKPVDLVDMLVWESYNAMHELDFSKLQHKAHAERKDPADFGQEKAKIEAKTEIEYLEHLLARQAKGSQISAAGLRHLNAINDVIPGYSTMSHEERLTKHQDIETHFLNTPHGGPEVKIPDREALKSSELYAYEQVADRQNVKGVTEFIKAKLPKDHPKKAAFINALIKHKPAESPERNPDQPPMSWAGKYYIIVSTAANDIFGLDLKEFSQDQIKVAEHEYKELNAEWAQKLGDALRNLPEEISEPEKSNAHPETTESLEFGKLLIDFQFKLNQTDTEKEPGITLLKAYDKAMFFGKQNNFIDAIEVLKTALNK